MMKGNRLLLVGSLVAATAMSSPAFADTVPPGGNFYDDDTSVHAPAIEAIAAQGITRGCNPPLNSRFCPDRAVTRAEMAAFLARALDLPDSDAAPFVDTDTSLFSADISRLAAADITRGCNPPRNDRFCPDAPVTREQMAAFLVRGLELPAGGADRFTDDSASLFEPVINSLAAAGITTGCNPPANDRFCPHRSVTRAEMATFLTRALGLVPIPVPPRPYEIEVMSRGSWEAQPAQGEFVSHTIDQITIHHSDDTGSLSGPEAFRAWQSWHLHLGWPDLAYHFIVGRDGRAYAGRPIWARGDTATEYDPTGHLLIVVEGDFDDESPSPEQLEMLAQLVAWGESYFDAPLVGGHRDHAATTCPGDNLYIHLESGELGARVAQITTEGGVTLRSEPTP